jgi:hypothetical protein
MSKNQRKQRRIIRRGKQSKTFSNAEDAMRFFFPRYAKRREQMEATDTLRIVEEMTNRLTETFRKSLAG